MTSQQSCCYSSGGQTNKYTELKLHLRFSDETMDGDGDGYGDGDEREKEDERDNDDDSCNRNMIFAWIQQKSRE